MCFMALWRNLAQNYTFLIEYANFSTKMCIFSTKFAHRNKKRETSEREISLFVIHLPNATYSQRT